MHDIHTRESVLSEHVTAVPKPSEGYGTTQHTNQEAHVPLQHNSPMDAAAPQHDATSNAGSIQVHTDVTIGEVVPPILDQMTDHGANEQASHIGPTFNNDGGTSSLDFVVDLISASVIPAAYPQSTTTDMMTSEPAVHTRTQHTLPNEIPRPDSTIDDRPLLPTAHP